VEATPRIAEKITVAQTLGALSLSLRSIADSQADLERAIATGAVTLPKNDPAAERRMITEFASQPIDNQVSFVTGGDVSHFQRKSVPITEVAPTQALAPQLRSGGNAPRTARGIEPVRAAIGNAPPVVPTVRVARGNAVEDVVVGGPASPTNTQDKFKDWLGSMMSDAQAAAAAKQGQSGGSK
jgi:pilus assembly protein CpaB